MSQPTLFQLQRDYEDYDSLSFVVKYRAGQAPIYPSSVTAFYNSYDRKPLAKNWDPPPVILERGEKKGTDIYDVELRFAVNKKAKEALSKLVGPYVEFLQIDAIGEREVGAKRNDHKPISRPPELFLMNPLVEVELGKGSISFRMAYRHITKYVFHPDDVRDLPIFRAKEDICILVSDSFRQLVESKGLRGLQFEDKFDWQASAVRALTSVSPPAKKKPPKIVEPPELLPENVLSSAKRITQDSWENARQHWKWVCEATKAREGNVDQKLQVSKPISERQLATLRKKVGGQLPSEFEHVLTHYACKVSFSWDLMESPLSEELPDEFREGCCCIADLWDVANLPALADVAKKHRQCGMEYFEKAFDRRLPFIDVGTGDYIAFDMQRGTKGCPIVYLSHDNDDRNNRVLGNNFVEFLLRWISVGCVGPDFPYLEAFVDARKSRINCHGRNAKRWRSLMASGV